VNVEKKVYFEDSRSSLEGFTIADFDKALLSGAEGLRTNGFTFTSL
jgi:hypothetical protein